MEYKIVEQRVKGVKFKRKYVDKFVVTEVEPNFDEPQESMYAVVLSSLITDKRFTSTEKIVILEISALSRRNGYCYATRGYIAKTVGVHSETVRITLQKMEDFGMIDRVYTNRLEDKEGKVHTGTYQRIYWKQQPLSGGVQEEVVGGLPEKVVGGVQEILVDKTEYNKQSITTDIYKGVNKENGIEVVDGDLLSIIDFYNNLFNKSVRSYKGFEANYEYWKGVHSVEKMKMALQNARLDKFWKNKMTLTILFRKKNTRGENVDYIEDLSQRVQSNQGMVAII